MAATIKDVAQLAGVSLSTVSRVLSNNPTHRVKPETAKKVLDAVVELNFFPNEHARELRRKKSNTKCYNIGVLLASASDSYNDSFFYDILLGIQAEAASLGHTISFSSALRSSSPTIIGESLKQFGGNGIILLGRMNADILHLVRKNTKHIVYAGLNPLNQSIDEVFCDGHACAKTAVYHLASCGYKKIGFIGTATFSGSSALINEYRYDGYIDSLKDLGLPFNKSYVIDTPLNIEMAYEALSSKLQSSDLPDAYFCANDYCAIGALKALREHRVKVPQDVAIIGIDDIDTSAFTKPSLTTIQIPRHEIGKFSVRILCDQIESRRKYPLKVELPYKLMIRESCGPSSNTISLPYKHQF